MNRLPLEANREILQNSTPEEPEQPAAIQTADLEVPAGGSMSKISQPMGTPRLKVQS
jgi:hypothetical protein